MAEDNSVPVLGVWVHMDGGQGGALAAKQVQSIHSLKGSLGHPYRAGRRKKLK